MTEYHEPWDALPEETRDFHRAMKSLVEEIEAVDWYNQRVAVTTDETLRQVLGHNRDEEMEHASMILEWLRRRMPGWDEQLRHFLFTEGEIAHPGEDAPSSGTAPDLGIGGLKE